MLFCFLDKQCTECNIVFGSMPMTMSPNSEKTLQIHDFLVFWDQATVFLQFTLFPSLATLSDAPEGDFHGHAIVGYT